MSASIHLAVRVLHVVAATVLLGGAAFTWNALRVGGDAHLLQYEGAFWGLLGLSLVSGVGNLGALGPPGPGTQWGTVLTAKLLVVAAVVLGSLVRTFAVVRARERADSARTSRRLRVSYAVTGWTLVVVVVLAEVLAHG